MEDRRKKRKKAQFSLDYPGWSSFETSKILDGRTQVVEYTEIFSKEQLLATSGYFKS